MSFCLIHGALWFYVPFLSTLCYMKPETKGVKCERSTLTILTSEDVAWPPKLRLAKLQAARGEHTLTCTSSHSKADCVLNGLSPYESSPIYRQEP